MKHEPVITSDELWAAIEDAVRDHIPTERPPNGFTVVEYSERFNLSRSTARCQLDRAVRAGKCTVQKVSLLDPDLQQARVTNVYTLRRGGK